MDVVQLPGPRGKLFSSSKGSRNPSPTITHQRRPGGDAAIKYGHDGGLRRVTPQDSSRRSSRFQSVSTTPSPHWPPLLGGIPTVEVPIRQLLTDFCASLHRRMQSVFSSPFHATLRPGLEGLTSTVLIIALPNWTREDSATTVPPRRCVFVGLAPPASNSLHP